MCLSECEGDEVSECVCLSECKCLSGSESERVFE